MKKYITQYGGLKKEIYILFIGKLVTSMGAFVWPMLTFLLTTKLGLSDSIATLLIATATLLSLPAALFGGVLADRFSRKNIIILFDLLTVGLYVLCAVLPIGYHTAVLAFFAGLFQTIESPAYDALNADYSTTAQRERAFSLSYLGYNLGFIVGASVSGLLFESFINLAFLLNGLSILVSTVLIIFFVMPENAVGEQDEEQKSLGEYERAMDDNLSILAVLRQRRVVLWVILIGCFASMTNTIVGILLPLQLKEGMGESGATIYGYLNSLNGLVVVLFTPLLTMWLRRLTEIPKSAIGQFLFVAGAVLFAVNGSTWLLFVGMFIYTLGEVVAVLGGNPYNSRRIPISHRGRIGGVCSVAYSLFGSLTQYFIGFVLGATNNNYLLIWMIFIACGLVAVVLYAMTYQPDRRTFPKLYEQTHKE